MLARLDEPELAPGEILDRRRIAPQPLGFIAQQRVLRARAPDRLLECLELLTLLHRLEQPLFPHERIDEDDAPDEQQRVLERTSSTTTGGRAAGSRGG